MPGPLDGVRVLELPAIGPVPFLGMLLADLGAEVIRVDKLPGARPGFGDAFGAGPLGRGRRSIGLDLRSPAGAEVLLRLAENADALIEGFRPGVAERLGVGPEAVLARNPKLVYGRMTGWGQDGPLAPTAGHDITYLALTGLLHGIGYADRPPVVPINYVADFGGGAMFLATGLLAALLHARATGEGQVIDAAMIEGASYLGSMTRTFRSMGGWRDEREANLLDGGTPNYRCYTCADGRYVAVGAIEPQFWAALCTAIGQDPATAPSPYDPAQHEACTAMLESTFVRKSRDEWADLFAPLDACVAPVLTLDEAPSHPHNVARGAYATVGGATTGAPAPRFSATPAAPGPLTEIGAATAGLLDEAGYAAAEVDELRAAGVIS
ncbi:MAG TPA: CaiB/BaiF CoA-transferase family protein [Jatrophihabitans sp.]|jgi:alpha-methylacyl-CoA racemase|uniref:CaiB/BaiF CoA transferase family protein n=1 Tax=Jatrophihabitans sp. TaxID=1932789 RepID=UPI002DFC0675|nr:CaiB/BaiF CoA-transferase family protein [Jatrophihabitans sp.]